MTTHRVQEMTDILRRLTSDEDPEQVRQEAEELIRTVTPQELSLAEQQLIEEGTAPEELRSLCEVHLKVLSDQVRDFRRALPTGHPVDTLMAEHEMMYLHHARSEAKRSTKNASKLHAVDILYNQSRFSCSQKVVKNRVFGRLGL